MAQREELILDVTAKLDQALRDVQALQKQLDDLAKPTEATVTVAATVQGQDDVEALAAQTAELDGAEANVVLGADDEATDVVEEVAEEVDDLDGAEAEVSVEADDNATDALEDVADAVGDLDGETAEVTVETNAEEATSGLDSITDSLGELGAAAKALAGPSGFVGAIVGGLGAATAAAYDFNQQVEELTALTGSSSEEASRLLAVLQDFGSLSLGEVEGLIARVVDKFAEMPNLADQLGVSAALPPLEMFVATVDALNSDTLSASEQLSLTMDIFGRRGVKAVNEIATSVGNLREGMAGIGDERILSDEDQAAADQMEKSIADMKGEFHELTVALGRDFIPLLAQAAGLAAKIVEGISPPEGQTVFGGINQESDVTLDNMNELNNQFDDFGGGDFLADETAALEGFNDEWLRYAQIRASNKAQDASMVDSTEDINESLANARAEAGLLAAAWTDLIADMADGNVETERGTQLWNLLRDELNLTEPEMVALAQQKLDEKLLADAEALEEAAAAALEMAEAMADLGDTIAEIDTDDLANLSGALETELNKVDDIFAGLKFDVDFQPALAEALDGLKGFGPDLQTLADEWANILEGKPIDIFGNVRADDAEFQEKVAALATLVQEGAVNAFDQGGVAAANTFVQSTAAQIAASSGLDIAEVYRIMGLPPDGTVDALIKPQIDAEAKADAIAILDALQGVNPDDPIVAYIRLGVQTGDIDPQIAEIAAKILAGEALGVPAKLEEFTQADVDAAVAVLEGYGVTVALDADPAPAEDTVDGFRRDTARADPAVVDVDADPAAAETTTNAFTSKPRTAGINLSILQLLITELLLNAVARDRTATITADAETAAAERELAYLARRRDAYVYAHTVNVGGGGTRGSSGVGPEPAMLAAPMAMTTAGTGGVGVSTLTAPAPMSISPVTMALPAAAPVTTNTFNTTIQAGMIGNRNEMDRLVSKALRRHTRLNGSRN